MNEAIQCRIFEGHDGALPDVAAAWAQCLAACPPEQQLFSFAWIDSWTRTYGNRPPWSGRTCVIAATDATGAPCAFLPLIFRRAHGLTYLTHAGFYQPLRSFPCVLRHAEAACRAMLRTLLHEVPGWDALRLGPLDDATPERAALLAALAAEARHLVALPRGRTIVNLLEPSFDAYARDKDFKRLEYYARRFSKEPGAEIRHLRNPDAATAAALYRELGVVEEHSWLAGAHGDLRFATPEDRAFWQRATETCLTPGGHLDVWVASLGGKPLSFRFVLSSGNVSYLVANQYDEQAAKFSLGWVLFLEHLREATARGIRVIDSAPGDLHYKSKLGGKETHMRRDLFIFRNSLKGRLLKQLLLRLHTTKEFLAAKPWGKSLAAHLPRV